MRVWLHQAKRTVGRCQPSNRKRGEEEEEEEERFTWQAMQLSTRMHFPTTPRPKGGGGG